MIVETRRSSWWFAHLLLVTTAAGLFSSGIAPAFVQQPVFAHSGATWSFEEVPLPRRDDLTKPPIVTALAVTPTGDHVAIAGDDHTVRIWDVADRKFVATLSGHRDWVRTLKYSPTGNLLASAGNDGRLIIWDAAAREILHRNSQRHAITRIVFDPSGKLLATVGFRSPLRYFDVSAGTEVQSTACPCEDMRAMAISPDSSHLVSGGRNGKVRIWRAGSSEVTQEFLGHRQRIRAIEFSPDGKQIASCGDDRVVRISQADGSEPFYLRGSPAKLMSLTFCGPAQIAVGGSDNLIRIWDLQSRSEEIQLAGHTGSVMALDYSGGTLVSAGYDTTVRIWKRTQNASDDQSAGERRVGKRTRGFEPQG